MRAVIVGDGHCPQEHATGMLIGLSLATEAGRIVEGDNILLVGGAAGFSGGVVPVIW